VSDVAALYLSRSIVEAMSGWPLADELRAAFEKIEGGLNPRMREFLSTLPQVISTKGGPRPGVASDRLVDVTRRLLDAVRARRVVSMRYFSAASNRAKTYEVQPYRLALAHGGLYLIAWVPQYDEFRTFATERIETLSVSEDVFRKTRDLPAELFGSSLGVFSGEAETIVLDFDARIALYVRGRVWHESQRLEETGTGGVRLTLEVSDDWALRSWILGFGATVTVRQPTDLAEAIADESAKTSSRYR
jgi:predicted DNA-binding transcriptional regulator YafY